MVSAICLQSCYLIYNLWCFSEDTIEENIVKCNVSKMELDYKFGGQNQGCIGS